MEREYFKDMFWLEWWQRMFVKRCYSLRVKVSACLWRKGPNNPRSLSQNMSWRRVIHVETRNPYITWICVSPIYSTNVNNPTKKMVIGVNWRCLWTRAVIKWLFATQRRCEGNLLLSRSFMCFVLPIYDLFSNTTLVKLKQCSVMADDMNERKQKRK